MSSFSNLLSMKMWMCIYLCSEMSKLHCCFMVISLTSAYLKGGGGITNQ